MLVPTIIKSIGEPREFESTDLKGVKRTVTAVDVVMESASDEFVATAYDNPAEKLLNHASIGDYAFAELRFSAKTKKREDGSNYAVQSVCILNIHILKQEKVTVY